MQLLSAADLAVIDKVLTSLHPPLPTQSEVDAYLSTEAAKAADRAVRIGHVRSSRDALSMALSAYEINGGGTDYVRDMIFAGDVAASAARFVLEIAEAA